jgi:hypothetical protein
LGDLGNLGDLEDEESTSSTSKQIVPSNISSKKVPEPLDHFTNALEICTWLVDRPYILKLANQMLEAKRLSPSPSPNVSDVYGNSDGFDLVSVGCSSGSSRNSSDVFLTRHSSAIDDVRII